MPIVSTDVVVIGTAGAILTRIGDWRDRVPASDASSTCIDKRDFKTSKTSCISQNGDVAKDVTVILVSTDGRAFKNEQHLESLGPFLVYTSILVEYRISLNNE